MVVSYAPGLPDDAVLVIEPDVYTAIVALTRDPTLDNMALASAPYSDWRFDDIWSAYRPVLP
jgi:hypothetical protein